jgi:hypothetical protein
MTTKAPQYPPKGMARPKPNAAPPTKGVTAGAMKTADRLLRRTEKALAKSRVPYSANAPPSTPRPPGQAGATRPRGVDGMDIAADYAQRAILWQRNAAILANKLHEMHRYPKTTGPVLFGDCQHEDCAASREMFAAVDFGPVPGDS